MNLKKILKAFKLNESTISMVLGAIVVLIVGSLVVNYLKNRQGSIPEELLRNDNSIELISKTHTVKSGETLWSIAQSYYGDGYKWVDIGTENKLTDASQIEIGQELTIPNVENKEISNTTLDLNTDIEPTEPENISISAATYEVVKGDNLWNIAVRAYGDGYKWVEIATENKLDNPNIIHAGNVLVLPR